MTVVVTIRVEKRLGIISLTRARSGESRQIGSERRRLALAKADGDAKLLEILLQGLAAEFGPARLEEGVDVALELRRRETDDTFGQPPQPGLRVLALHRLPVRLHEIPGELARVYGRQERARDERRVLRPELAVDGPGECLRQELALTERGQRIQKALLLLRCRRRPELLQELVVAGGVAR